MSTYLHIPESLDIGSYEYLLRQKSKKRQARHAHIYKNKKRRKLANNYLGYYVRDSKYGHSPSIKTIIPEHDEWLYFDYNDISYDYAHYGWWHSNNDYKEVWRFLGLNLTLTEDEWNKRVDDAFRQHKIIGERIPLNRLGTYDKKYKVKIHIPEHTHISKGRRIDIDIPERVVRMRHSHSHYEYSSKYYSSKYGCLDDEYIDYGEELIS